MGLTSFINKVHRRFKKYQYDRYVVTVVKEWGRVACADGDILRFQLKTLTQDWEFNAGTFTRRTAISNEPTFKIFDYTSTRTSTDSILFTAPFLTVTMRESEKKRPLLEAGLSADEKLLAIKIVRDFFRTSFGQREGGSVVVPAELPEKFYQPATVDVVLWVGGWLRGSMVSSRKTLYEALLAGAISSAQDSRFRPVEQSELDTVNIEVVVISRLHIPLPKEWRLTIRSLTELGFLVRSGSKQGWFFPTVHNVTKFNDDTDFIKRLCVEKAGITDSASSKVGIWTFQVDNFIEVPEKEGFVTIKNSLLQKERSCVLSQEGFSRVDKAAGWLCSIQLENGFIPKVVDPYRLKQYGLDWVRMAYAALALASYGGDTGVLRYSAAARTTLAYIEKHKEKVPHNEILLTSVYAAKGYAVLGNSAHLKELVVRIEEYLAVYPVEEPLSRLQVAALFIKLSPTQAARAAEFVDMVWREWNTRVSQKEDVSLAAYAELLVLLPVLGKKNEYSKVREWYTALQQEDGSFPNTTYNDVPYSRGTSKIFEALASDSDNRDTCERSLHWLHNLQYDEQTLFYIPESFQTQIRGAFMHDYGNREAWSDAAAHYIIGQVRFSTFR